MDTAFLPADHADAAALAGFNHPRHSSMGISERLARMHGAVADLCNTLEWFVIPTLTDARALKMANEALERGRADHQAINDELDALQRARALQVIRGDRS